MMKPQICHTSLNSPACTTLTAAATPGISNAAITPLAAAEPIRTDEYNKPECVSDMM